MGVGAGDEGDIGDADKVWRVGEGTLDDAAVETDVSIAGGLLRVEAAADFDLGSG